MKRVAIGIATAVVLGALIFLGYGSWHTASTLESVLRVGAPTAQNSGWPAPEGPQDIGFKGDPAAAFGHDFEDVLLEGELGPLPAWLVPPQQGVSEGATWAIVVHGIGGRRENGYRFLAPFRDAGMPTLLISYRNDEGAPRDPGGFHAFGLTEWRDLETAARYALSRGAASLVLFGESMGGGIVGQFMRRSEHAGRVAALAFDAPALDFPDVLLNNMNQAGAPLPAILAPAGMRLFAFRNGLSIADADVRDAIAEFEGPVFLSHGAGDQIVPVATSDALAERRAGRITYLRTEANHILSWKENPERYEKALSEFLATVR
jgi:uncharacterized protein